MKSIYHFIQKFAKNYAHNTMEKSLYNSLNIDMKKEEIKKVPNMYKKYMLYMHIPFCHTFCPYCSFHKYYYNEEACKKYFISLRKELTQIKKAGYDFDSLYVGGGTTLINEQELKETLLYAKSLFNIKNISCETDPNHINPEKLQDFVGLIDRLSIGVQSFDNEILRKVGRYEKFGSQEILIEKLSKAIKILPTISLDLIFNMPYQTKEQLLTDIKIAKMLKPGQITLYPLMKSPLTRDAIAKTLGVSNVDHEKEFYDVIREEFKDYTANNAWSFSSEASQSEKLCDEYVGSNHEYVGVGSGAFSFLNGRLLINAFNLDDYSQMVDSGKSPVIGTCDFSNNEKLKYIFLTELFDGEVNIDKYNAQNNANIKKDLFKELSLLKIANAIYEENGKIKPTRFGSYLSLVLMKDFYTGMDKVRAIFKNDAKVKSSKILRVMQEDISASLQKTENNKTA